MTGILLCPAGTAYIVNAHSISDFTKSYVTVDIPLRLLTEEKVAAGVSE